MEEKSVGVYKTEGIIFKKAELSDTDRLLTVYTQKFGKILVRAKGVGKKESKLKSLIEPFNIYEFMLARSKNIDVLANSYTIKEFLYLRQNLENLALAIYFAELADKLIVAPEQDENIWLLLVRAFEALDNHVSHVILNPANRGEESAANASNKIPHAREILHRQTAVQDDRLQKLKEAFEKRLLEYLGHPNFSVRGKSTEREKQNYLYSLAGEEIKAVKFLGLLGLI